MEKSNLLLLAFSILLFSSCDSHSPAVEEDQIVAKLREYDLLDGIPQDTFVDHYEVAIPKGRRIELKNFPHVYVRSDRTGWGSGSEGPIDLPQSHKNSVYLLFDFDDEIGWPHLKPFNVLRQDESYINDWKIGLNQSPLTVQDDSMTIGAYAFLLKRPGLVYPSEIEVNFHVNDQVQVIVLDTERHGIDESDFVTHYGSDFPTALSKEFVDIEFEASEVDSMLLPAVVVNNLERYYDVSPDSVITIDESVELIGSIPDSRSPSTASYWTPRGGINYQMVPESEFRFMLFERDPGLFQR